MSRIGIFLVFIFLVMSFPLYSENSEDNTKNGENTVITGDSLQWEQGILEELSQKLKAAKVPLTTLKFVLKRIDRDTLPKDREKALNMIFYLTKKYDLELRRGKPYSRVELELKRELALSKKDVINEKKLQITKATTQLKEKLYKDKNDIKVKEIKKAEKIKKEKIIEKKIETIEK